jgi:hypothetical protein
MPVKTERLDEDVNMAVSSIRKEISGVIAHIDYYSGYLKILSADGRRYSVHQNRIVNAPCGHRCLARKDDEITFLVNPDDHITEIRFLHPPDAEIADEEVSIVDTITNDLIFGKRITPDCHCPILIGTHHKLPEIEVGMIVKHNLGRHKNKPMATNVRVDWNYGENQ